MKRTVLLLLLLSCVVPACLAAPITWALTVDTSLVSGTSGFIDFQFNPGAGSQAATVTIADFTPASGLAGSPSVIGAISGLLPGQVTINNSSGLNDYFQPFNFSDNMQFKVIFSGPAIDSPDGTSTFGSSFGFGLFDAYGAPILTTDVNGFAANLDLNLDGSTSFSNFPSDADGGAPVVTAAMVEAGDVPEPSTVALTLLGLGTLALFRRRR